MIELSLSSAKWGSASTHTILKRQVEERTGKTIEQLYAERAKRVGDAIELRVPDRVPFSVLIEPHAYSGIPNSTAYCDPIMLKRTMRQMAVDLEPDMAEGEFPSSGAAITGEETGNDGGFTMGSTFRSG